MRKERGKENYTTTLNLLVLQAETNPEALDKIANILIKRAWYIARGLFESDTNSARDAVDNAENEARDSIVSGKCANKLYPFAYTKGIITNSILKAFDRRKVRGVPLTARPKGGAKKSIRHQLAGIDESFAEFKEAEDDNIVYEQGYDANTSGWQVIEIIARGTRRKQAPLYPKHWTITLLEELLKYEWWWGGQSSHLHGVDPDTEYTVFIDRQCKYALLTGIIELIESPSEKKVMLRFLHSHPMQKQKEIAQELGYTKQYVSKVVCKWIKHEWKWRKGDIYTAKLILLTTKLVKLYKEIVKRNNEKAKSLQGHSRQERERTVMGLIEHDLYETLRNDSLTKSYFHNLEWVDTSFLVDICHNLCLCWGERPPEIG